jgi:hypothetical protein
MKLDRQLIGSTLSGACHRLAPIEGQKENENLRKKRGEKMKKIAVLFTAILLASVFFQASYATYTTIAPSSQSPSC